MTYASQRVTSRHKVYVEIDGVIHELLPVKQQFQVRDLGADGMITYPITQRSPLIASDLKLARHLLRKALRSIDARERARQLREKNTTMPLPPREQRRTEQRQAEMRRLDAAYESDPRRFSRAPRGYYKRRQARLAEAGLSE